MTNWVEVKTYLRARYGIVDDRDVSVTLQLNVLPGRTRVVVVSYHTLLAGTEDWVVIESPFGTLGEVDLMEAATSVGTMVCGGIGTLDRAYATVRHAVPLHGLEVEDFERPFQLVVGAADAVEFELSRP